MLFLDQENWLWAIIVITFVNIFKALHFLGRFRNLHALHKYPIYPFLHVSCLKERNWDLYFWETQSVAHI